MSSSLDLRSLERKNRFFHHIVHSLKGGWSTQPSAKEAELSFVVKATDGFVQLHVGSRCCFISPCGLALLSGVDMKSKATQRGGEVVLSGVST